jgi:hypothetical protein
MRVMTTTDAPSSLTLLSQRLWQIVAMMRTAVGACLARDRSVADLAWLIHGRTGRLALRFERMVARLVTGVVIAKRRPCVRKARVVVRQEGVLRLPTGWAWLVGRAQETAFCALSIEDLLARPGMDELLAASPGARRVLRQFCWMLGVVPGPLLALPALPADRKLAPRKSRVGQYRPRKRVVKPANRGPKPSAMAVIFAALNPGVAIWPEIKPPKWKPPWFSIGR